MPPAPLSSILPPIVNHSDRLSQIIETVQDGRLRLARDLTEKIEVSLRTIYRDIDTFLASGVPIEGRARRRLSAARAGTFAADLSIAGRA